MYKNISEIKYIKKILKKLANLIEEIEYIQCRLKSKIEKEINK